MAKGKLVADEIEHSSVGSLNTEFVVKGSTKNWTNNTISTDTHTIQASFNTSSLTDDGAGRSDVVFTNNMSSVRYSITSTCSYNGSYLFPHFGNNSLQTTGHYRINTANALAAHDTADAQTDYDMMCTQVCGDLA
jgi:hypothetical protein